MNLGLIYGHGVRWGCSQLEYATSLLRRLQVTHDATNSEAYSKPSVPDYRHEVVLVDFRVLAFELGQLVSCFKE